MDTHFGLDLGRSGTRGKRLVGSSDNKVVMSDSHGLKTHGVTLQGGADCKRELNGVESITQGGGSLLTPHRPHRPRHHHR